MSTFTRNNDNENSNKIKIIIIIIIIIIMIIIIIIIIIIIFPFVYLDCTYARCVYSEDFFEGEGRGEECPHCVIPRVLTRLA